jgi:hypothetical protein
LRVTVADEVALLDGLVGVNVKSAVGAAFTVITLLVVVAVPSASATRRPTVCAPAVAKDPLAETPVESS